MSESWSQNPFLPYTSENNFDTEPSCMSLSCCLRALDNVEGTKRAWSPNRQAEMGVWKATEQMDAEVCL